MRTEEDGNREEAAAEWKCLKKPDMSFSLDTAAIFSTAEASSWFAGTISGGFGPGFTGMILTSTNNERNSTEEYDNSDDAGGSCLDVAENEGGGEEAEEENQNYWSSILNLVNRSSSPPNSPPAVF